MMAGRLPVEADEPVYLRAAYHYADVLRRGEIGALPFVLENIEHPALVKLLYSLAWLAPSGSGEVWFSDALWGARLLSALFGTAAVGLASWIHPVAGLLLAVHPLTIYYTSAAMLESVPQFFAILAIFAWRLADRRDHHWADLGSFAMGAAAASKFVYVLPLWPGFVKGLWCFPRSRLLLPLIAVLAFAALNPMIWRDPPDYLSRVIWHHLSYSSTYHVQRYGFPWYQPLLWLSRSPPELMVLIFGLAGAIRGLFRSRFQDPVAWGTLSALLFLLAWPTKWPHYALLATPFLCLSVPNVLVRSRNVRILISVIALLGMAESVRVIFRQQPYLDSYLLHHQIPSPFEARLEGIRLEGLRWERPGIGGSALPITLCWRPERSADSNLSAFVHLLGEIPDPRTGNPLWAQVDAQPLSGAYPATLWLPGVVFCERYRIPMPQDLPPGIYLLTAGWYRWEDGHRVPVQEGPQDPRYPDALVIGRLILMVRR